MCLPDAWERLAGGGQGTEAGEPLLGVGVGFQESACPSSILYLHSLTQQVFSTYSHDAESLSLWSGHWRGQAAETGR